MCGEQNGGCTDQSQCWVVADTESSSRQLRKTAALLITPGVSIKDVVTTRPKLPCYAMKVGNEKSCSLGKDQVECFFSLCALAGVILRAKDASPGVMDCISSSTMRTWDGDG